MPFACVSCIFVLRTFVLWTVKSQKSEIATSIQGAQLDLVAANGSENELAVACWLPPSLYGSQNLLCKFVRSHGLFNALNNET